TAVARHADCENIRRCSDRVLEVRVVHGSYPLPFFQGKTIRQAREISATLQACAMQPRGRNGCSPSKISDMYPAPASRIWERMGRSRGAIVSRSRPFLMSASTYHPVSHGQTQPLW